VGQRGQAFAATEASCPAAEHDHWLSHHMRQQIQQRFEHNIGRVRNLLTLYRNLAPRGQGRRPVHATDMLRSALVLLHASLEDVLRSVAAWKFPASGEAVLNDVPLVGLGEGGRPEKFHLGKLVPHRAKSVQALIDESVKAAINRMSFNNTTDIASILGRVGVDPQVFQWHFPRLAPMIERRHHIVHQADRNDQPGVGQFRTRSLSMETVEGWLVSTEDFVGELLRQIPDDLV